MDAGSGTLISGTSTSPAPSRRTDGADGRVPRVRPARDARVDDSEVDDEPADEYHDDADDGEGDDVPGAAPLVDGEDDDGPDGPDGPDPPDLGGV